MFPLASAIVAISMGSLQVKLSPDDQSVIEAVFPMSDTRPGREVVLCSTTTSVENMTGLPDGRKEASVKEMVKRNHSSSVISYKPKWASYLASQAKFATEPDWKHFWADFPGAAKKVFISLPGFSDRGTKAAIYMGGWEAWDDRGGKMSGGGASIYILTKGAKGWKVTGVIGNKRV